ncbi:MAG: folylpolyglutamate synthase/dihydrofolate synthase family protein [Planctomycetaceae bacterium]
MKPVNAPAAQTSLHAAGAKVVDEISDSTPQQSSAAHQFLMQRIDYERVPPSGNSVDPFKLSRMADLLHRLGNPQLSLPCVHIAGTKGKGSTASMVAAITQAAGIKTGLFTSPHLYRFEERIQVQGVPICPTEFEQLVEELRPLVEAMDEELGGGPTFFELVTALAWMHFRKQGVQLVVLEVGLGGRLDATNLCRPLVTIITSISRDHTRLLGETIPLITAEKGGIIKQGVPLLTGVDQPEAITVLTALCQERTADCYRVDENISLTYRPQTIATPVVPQHSWIDVVTPWRKHEGIFVPLAGRHQARNAALVIAAVDCLDASGTFTIGEEQIVSGLRNLKWPLRIETVHTSPLVILDAAHNPASITSLIDTLRDVRAAKRWAIFGASKDKEADTMLRLMGESFDELILTPFLGNPRSLSVERLENLSLNVLGRPCRVVESPAAALELTAELCQHDDLLCVTGSIFLAAEAQTAFPQSSFVR